MHQVAKQSGEAGNKPQAHLNAEGAQLLQAQAKGVFDSAVSMVHLSLPLLQLHVREKTTSADAHS